VLGEGERDIIFVPGLMSHLELLWEEPETAGFFRRLATFGRLILFDKRDTGLSDRALADSSLEERMNDVRAVMRAAGSAEATLFGYSEGAPMSILFAATYPERVTSLILGSAPPAGSPPPTTPAGQGQTRCSKLLSISPRTAGGRVKPSSGTSPARRTRHAHASCSRDSSAWR
jgi:pimeloyl-ACP methyl ester carboxylesterase